MRFILLLPAILLASCNSGGCASLNPIPPYVAPSNDPVPPQPVNGCEAEAAHLEELGGCGVWSDHYADDCKAVDDNFLKDHHQQANHTCVIAAKTCPEALQCK